MLVLFKDNNFDFKLKV